MPLPAVQHGGGRNDSRGQDFPLPPVQLLDLLLLTDLQVLHLHQVSGRKKEELEKDSGDIKNDKADVCWRQTGHHLSYFFL